MSQLIRRVYQEDQVINKYFNVILCLCGVSNRFFLKVTLVDKAQLELRAYLDYPVRLANSAEMDDPVYLA